MDMNSFISFDKMLTPTIIKIVFWIGVGFSVLMGLMQMIGGGFYVFLGLLTIILGPLAVRVYCELLIIIFKMHETITDMRNIMSNQSTNQPMDNQAN